MISIWIPIFAFIGLLDSAYLLYKKLRHEKLACLIGEDCDKVVKSKYGYVAGVPNEAFGLAYYLFALGTFGYAAIGGPFLAGVSIVFLLKIATVLASFASVYLLVIQAFVLKEWCEYCLLSAFVNFDILLILFF